jgi:AcrR family transcriptional regulator
MAAAEIITKGYVEFELLNGRSPYSVFELTKKLEISEEEFYAHFSSLTQVRQAVLTHLIGQTLQIMDADPNYDTFSAREKLLSLFFTLFEQFKTQRSYLLVKYADLKLAPQSRKDFDQFMEQLNARVETILLEAKAQDEIKDRAYVGKHYAKGYKLVFTYLFRVWINDESAEFSTTDAAIEKSVNLSFDVMGESPLDSLLDFGKFAWKTKVF